MSNYCLPDRLKKAMVERGFNLRMLAEKAAIPIKTLNEIMEYRATPYDRVFDTLAEALDIKADYLRGETDIMYEPIEEQGQEDGMSTEELALPNRGGKPLNGFNNEKFGRVVKSLGLSINEISELSGISDRTLKNWIAGVNPPSKNFAEYFSKFAGIPINEFVDEPLEENKAPSRIQPIGSVKSLEKNPESIKSDFPQENVRLTASYNESSNKFYDMLSAAKGFVKQLDAYSPQAILAIGRISDSLEKLNDAGIERAVYAIEEMVDNKRYRK